MTLTATLAAFAVAPAPAEIGALVGERVLDTLGVALRALSLPTSTAAIAHAVDQGGTAQALPIGIPHALPAASAAFIGGVLAHSLDYDDTHLPSILHPSASVIPAVLSAAQPSGASGRAVADAIAVGLEICCRLGMAGYDPESRNSTFFEHGQHATSICGTVASAAAAAAVLGLDAEQVAHAMGIAVSMGAGVIEANRAGGTVKRLHCGLAASNGVTAALLARRGFTGPPTALEGRFGFFEAHLHGRYNANAVTGDLGQRWEAARIFTKPYPCNHFTHAGIDAAIAARARGLRADEIDTITLGVAMPTVRTIGDPLDAKRAPETGYQAQFSGPYTVVAALLGGSGVGGSGNGESGVGGRGLGLGLEDFTDALARDPTRRALMARVTVEADAACDAIYPNQFPARLTILLRDGTEHTEFVETTRGGPERPLTRDEIETKFRDNAARALPGDAIDQIADACARIADLPDAAAILAPASRTKNAKTKE